MVFLEDYRDISVGCEAGGLGLETVGEQSNEKGIKVVNTQNAFALGVYSLENSNLSKVIRVIVLLSVRSTTYTVIK